MAATPGSDTKLNVLTGIAKVMSITTQEMTTYATRVLDKGILLLAEDGKVYLTDGVTALSALSPRIDQLLISTEKTALTKTFSGTSGAYQATEGGFLVLGASGKMSKDSLPDTMIGADGKIALEWLPDTVRAGVVYKATYADLADATEEEKKSLVFVVDASGDDTVESGWATYVWQNNDWVKISEGESVENLDLGALLPNEANVEAAGAVMYDHTIVLTPPSMTQYIALLDVEEGGVGG